MASGLAPTYAWLLLARAIIGASEASYAVVTPSLLSDCYPAERRARVLGIFYAAIPVGSALGFIVGGGLRRTKYDPERRERERRREETPKKKGVAVGSLLMSAAIALVRAQYGSPFGMAQALLEKFQKRKEPPSPSGDTSRPQADIRPVRRVAG